MADHTKQPHLQHGASQPTGAPGLEIQPDLPVDRESDMVGLFWLTQARTRQLVRALDSMRPRYVFDLRVLPSFDGTGMTRRSLFRRMEAAGCTYVDVMGRMGNTDRQNPLFEPGAFEECVRSVCGTDLAGPMLFLCQSREELAWSSSVLPELLQPAPRGGWRVRFFGADASEVVDAFTDTVQPWELGEILYVVASPSETTGWILDDRGRPAEPINLSRGSSVKVAKLQIGQWTDVEVLRGPYRGRNVRLASNAHVARSVK